ncbi:MAG: ADP-ribose diphosphatase [Saprospiraceae bacterium]|jgi:ADP-ribose diphosphatase
MRKKPTINSIKAVTQSRIFNVEEVSLSFDNGEQRLHERLNPNNNGVVVVMPIDQQYLYMVYEYAVGFDRYELGLVKGMIDQGESALDAANRELQEEIGYAAKDIYFIRDITTRPHYSTAKSSLFIAKGLYPKQLQGDEPEALELVKWPLDKLNELYQHPAVTEARTLCSLIYLQQYIKGIN